jgi:hypothetical protein
VRGTLHADSGCYDLKNAVHIFQTVMIPESQDAIVVLSQPSVANSILLVVRMLATIDLDNESRFPADEIDDVGADRLLANELAAFDRSGTQSIP